LAQGSISKNEVLQDCSYMFDKGTFQKLSSLIKYAHFQNLHILIHEEIQRKIKDEIAELSEAKKQTYKTAQNYFSDPTAMRSLFQEKNDESRLKRAATKLKKGEDALKGDPVALAELFAKRFEKQRKLADSPKVSSREKSDFLKLHLSHMQLFNDFLEIGQGLKAHVIRNLAKSLETARKAAFTKFKNGQKLGLPKTQPLARISNYFIDLCEVSTIRKSETEFLVNIDKTSRKLRVGLDFARKEDDLKVGKITKIGVIHGKIAVVIMYKKQIKTS